MLRILDLTTSRKVIFEKTHRHSVLLKNMIDLLDKTYYFRWPDYPANTLYYKGDICVFQINDWFELCHMGSTTSKTYVPKEYNTRYVEGQNEIGMQIKKMMKIPENYHFNIPPSLPVASLGYYKDSGMESEKEKERNDR